MLRKMSLPAHADAGCRELQHTDYEWTAHANRPEGCISEYELCSVEQAPCHMAADTHAAGTGLLLPLHGIFSSSGLAKSRMTHEMTIAKKNRKLQIMQKQENTECVLDTKVYSQHAWQYRRQRADSRTHL